MRSEFRDGKLLLMRDDEEREPLLGRLRRIEGQVRGIQQMVSQDRYCADELQQASAVLAAMREVMRLLVSQHVDVGLRRALAGGTPPDEAMADIERVLQTVVRDQ